MNNNNYIQLIGLLIVVGFSIISWIFRKLQEQSAKKRVRDMQEQRQLEMLRTGRDPASIPTRDDAESQRQREIAARREAQLAELRRRAAARADQSRQRSAPIASIPGSAGPTVPQRPVQRTAAPPREAPRPAPRQPATRAGPHPARQTALRPNQAPRKQEARIAEPIAAPQEDYLHRVVPDSPVSPVVQAQGPRTPEEWRRAILANEILSRPLSLREGGESVPVPF